jgi:HemY protein
MLRIVLSLALIALAVTGAMWIAGQTGDVALSLGGWRIVVALPVFILALALVAGAAILAWTTIRLLWRLAKTSQ